MIRVFCAILFLGINIFLDGFVPTENLRFRETSLIFKVSETATEEEIKRLCCYDYPKMSKQLGKLISERYFCFMFNLSYFKAYLIITCSGEVKFIRIFTWGSPSAGALK